jgi:Plasmid recombination enzyme
MVHNNNRRGFRGKEEAHLVEDFEPRPGTFRIGLKSLNINSVAAAKGNPSRVLLAAGRHLAREIPAEKDSACGRIRPHLSCNNYVLAGPPDAEGIASLAAQLMGEAGVLFPVRKDCIMGIEVVFSLPATTSVDIRAYFEAALAWTREEFAPAPIISAVVHLDEPHPHMHVLVLPLIDGSMQGGKVAGYKATFNRRKRDFYLNVARDFGLDEPVAKPSFGKTQRQAYAAEVVETLVAFLPAPDNKKLVRDELLHLVSRSPFSLGRALGVPMVDPAQAHASAEPVLDAREDMSDVPSVDGGTAHAGTSTSCLCSDVGATPMGNGEDLTPERRSSQAPIYLSDYVEVAGLGPDHEDAVAQLDLFQPVQTVREREDEHPASTWDEELGRHFTPPPPKPSNRTKAGEDVDRALETLHSRRLLNPNKEDQ